MATTNTLARPAAEKMAEQSRLECWVCNVIGFDAWRLAGALLVLVAIVLARAPRTQVPDALFVSDGFGYYIYLPSLVVDRDLDLSNQLTRLPYEGTKRFFQISDKTGRNTNQFPVGCAIFWLPFFLVADGGVLLCQSLGLSIPRNGFGFPYELPVYVGSFVYGLAAIWLMRQILRKLFDHSTADLSLFAIVFATPMAYYLWFEPNMSHSVAVFVVALWVYVLLRIDLAGDRRWTAWILLGIALGLVNLIRPYNGVLGLAAIPVAIDVCRRPGNLSWIRALWPAFLRLAVCCTVSIVMLGPQVWMWRMLYGQWFVVPRGSGYEAMSWFGPDLPSFVTSIFAFWPVYLAALTGLIVLGLAGVAIQSNPKNTSRRLQSPSRAPQEPGTRDELAARESVSGEIRGPFLTPHAADFVYRTAPWLVLVVAIIVYLVAGSRDWMLGTAFGQRRMVDWSPLLAIGLAVTINWLGHRIPRPAVAVTLGLLAAGNCVLCVLYLLTDWIPEYGRVL